jgi:hypothetical protein
MTSIIRKPPADMTEEELLATIRVLIDRVREPDLDPQLTPHLVAKLIGLHDELGLRIRMLAEGASVRDIRDLDLDDE